MTETSQGTSVRLRLAGGLLVVGLAVQTITLWWKHPTAFVLFLLLGGGCVAVGVLLYLSELLFRRE